MFELTVHSDFTLPVPGTAGRPYTRGQAVTDAVEVKDLLDSEFHVFVTKVLPGTHQQPEPVAPAPKKAVAVVSRKEDAPTA